MNTFLRWIGGKGKLINDIPAPTNIKRYCEPFIGGGAMFLHVIERFPNIDSYIGDTNKALICLWSCVRDSVGTLDIKLTKLEDEYRRTHKRRQMYYKLRDEFNHRIRENEYNARTAALFMFLNGTCFNGLYRVNKLGEFNAAWGHRNRWSFDRDNIFQISSVIKNTEIFHGDYRKSGGFITRDTFVYLDPPYDGSYDKYTSEGFDSQELKRFFTHCVDKGAYCVLSNSSHIRNYKRYGEYKIIPVNTRWAINSSAQTNKSSSEILVVGNATRKTHRK